MACILSVPAVWPRFVFRLPKCEKLALASLSKEG